MYLTYTDVTNLYFFLNTVFQSFRENQLFYKFCDIYDFGWLLSALKFIKCRQCLYKIHDKSMEGFVAN